MSEKFNRERVRFHVYEPQVLVIQGWFEGDKRGKERFFAQVDKKQVSLKATTQQGIEVRKKYLRYKTDIDVEYFLWIRLPEKGRELKVFHERTDGGKDLIYKGSLDALAKKRRRMDSWAEALTAGPEGLVLRGWYISSDKTRVALLGKGGKPLQARVKLGARGDVQADYPEAEPEDIHGFELAFAAPSQNFLRLVIQSKEKQTLTVISVDKMLKNKKGLVNACQKGILYWKRKGTKQLLKRVAVEVLHRDEISYERFRKKHEPSQAQLKEQRDTLFAWTPKFSIVVPLYKTKEEYLKELVRSVQAQTYGNWELCLSDGSGEDSVLKELLKRLSEKDRRIRVIAHDRPLRISENTNAALEAAGGDFIVFADHDDLLAPHALYECVRLLNQNRKLDLIYSDEDKVSMDGRTYFQPHFKSDYNPDLLCSMNYISHLCVVRRSLQEQVGLLNPEFDGAQDYDFILRCTEVTDQIGHIPKVLYHWRAHRDSTAENPESKRYAFEAGARAIQAHYDRLGIRATVRQGEYPGLYISDYEIVGDPLVSIIIPNKDHIGDLKKCITSIEEKSDYPNYEYIIVENNSTQPETFAYYKELEAANPKVHVVFYEGAFNYSDINNFGVAHAKGSYYWFLNNDTQIIRGDCIRQLLGYCTREDVGIVGSRLYYEDDIIQHAGVVLGFGGIAGHAFIGSRRGENGYFSRIICAQNYSAVTAASMMVKAEVFHQVGGFSTDLRVAFNDIDFCMKVRGAGKLIVYNPYAELYHFESKSRGLEDTQEKIERFNREMARFLDRWSKQVNQGDPYYNPNLTLDKADFSMKV